MKIASVCAVPPSAGGLGTSAAQIRARLAVRHEVTDFNPTTLRPWLKYGHGSFAPSLLWRLRRYDVVYLHYPFFGTAEIVSLAKLLYGKRLKLIVHYHMDTDNLSGLARFFSWPSVWLRPTLLKQADLIVTASLDYIKSSRIKDYYRAHPEKFREIPFAVDLKKFAPKNLNRPASNRVVAYAQEIVHYVNEKFIKKNRLDLLFVGGLDRAHYFKGLDVLFEALGGLPEEKWRLTIVGDGDRRGYFEKAAQKHGLAGRIRFAGRLSDVDLVRAYQESDLLILPSLNRHEAFGIVLIEALACGVPVLASDLPGVRSVFNNFQEGLLAAPGDASDLRKKLEFVMADEPRRREMALAARRLAEKKYGEERLAADLGKLFN